MREILGPSWAHESSGHHPTRVLLTRANCELRRRRPLRLRLERASEQLSRGASAPEARARGEGRGTLKALIGGATVDAGATAALGLPSGVGGVALETAAGKPAFVSWAKASGTDENASATYSLSTPHTLSAFASDFSKTGTSIELSPSAGKVDLDSSGSPTVVVAN